MDDTTYPHAASLPNVLFGGGYNDPYVIPGPNMTYVAIANSSGLLVRQHGQRVCADWRRPITRSGCSARAGRRWIRLWPTTACSRGCPRW